MTELQREFVLAERADKRNAELLRQKLLKKVGSRVLLTRGCFFLHAQCVELQLCVYAPGAASCLNLGVCQHTQCVDLLTKVGTGAAVCLCLQAAAWMEQLSALAV